MPRRGVYFRAKTALVLSKDVRLPETEPQEMRMRAGARGRMKPGRRL